MRKPSLFNRLAKPQNRGEANFRAAKELEVIVNEIEELNKKYKNIEKESGIDRLKEATQTVEKSWSGSWIGYQATVYYNGLQPSPPGAHFSQEWGIEDNYISSGTTGDWREFTHEQVTDYIYHLAKNPNLQPFREISQQVADLFERKKSDALSIIHTLLVSGEDKYVARLQEKIEKLSLHTASQYIEFLRPSGQLFSRDSLAMTQGLRVPPHFAVMADYMELYSPSTACDDLYTLVRDLLSHLSRQSAATQIEQNQGSHIFIGHGRSRLWRELKDFVEDRLNLPSDEFNRVPVAGITNIARLSQMLDEATFAFLIFTAEDELADGEIQARMNVIHEAGLFQGKLGFSRAIVLLEEGCSEFTNIQGLGQIRFPKGNIKATFEEVRLVLEREGIIEPE